MYLLPPPPLLHSIIYLPVLPFVLWQLFARPGSVMGGGVVAGAAGGGGGGAANISWESLTHTKENG